MPKKNSDARARFAQRLRSIRIPRGYKTARSFAVALGIDENRYTRYERAEVEPDLQLLMNMCNLLDATPNDLLCDTIGSPPVEFGMPHGFGERPGSGYFPGAAQPQSNPRPNSNSLEDVRKAAGWQLASVIATVEAKAKGIDLSAMPYFETLRHVGPIHARVIADVYVFMQELPDRLQGIEISQEIQDQISNLMQEIIAASKRPSNDND